MLTGKLGCTGDRERLGVTEGMYPYMSLLLALRGIYRRVALSPCSFQLFSVAC